MMKQHKFLGANFFWLLIFILAIFLSFSISASAEIKPKGHLFIIGGGDRSESMMRRFVGLATKTGSGKIVVLSMASATPDETGRSLVDEFQRLGVKDAVYYSFTRQQAENEQSTLLLNGAGGIYFAGGVQTRITEAILDTPVHRKIIELYRAGTVVAGTSAGAAVMSELMITGDEVRKVEEGHEFETIQAGNIVLARGLGLVKRAILDQHFATRKRHNRLISVVAEHPNLLGVGIDESTAIIVNPDETFEVIGNKNVIVYDGRRAKIKIRQDKSIALRGLTTHILLSGERFSLRKKKPL